MLAKQRLVLHHWLRQYDPGLLHSRQATRTVLSVVITALLLQDASFTAIFLACFASGSVQQGLVGYRREDIWVTMGLSAAAMLVYALLSMLLLTPVWLSSLGMIVAAFLVFYIRRFGPRYQLFPMFVWLVGFSTTVFVKTFSWLQMQDVSLAMVLGLSVAILIRFWLIPDRRAMQFAFNLKTYFSDIRHALTKINQQLKHMEHNHHLDSYLAELKSKLRHIFVQNEAILSLSYGKNNFCNQRLFHYLNCQYNAGKSIIMVIESLLTLRQQKHIHLARNKTYLDQVVARHRHQITYLCRSLHPVITYQQHFHVALSLHKHMDASRDLNHLMNQRIMHFDDTTLAVFNYLFNFQHLIYNLATFEQDDEATES